MNHQTISDRKAVRDASLIMAMLPVVAAVSTMCAPPAAASPVEDYINYAADNICAYFDQSPYVSAVQPMFTAVQEDTEFTSEQTAEVLVSSVLVFCPQHMDLLQRFANQDSTTTSARRLV